MLCRESASRRSSSATSRPEIQLIPNCTNKEQLLAAVQDLMRTMPPRSTIHSGRDENLSWLSRVAALIGEWCPTKAAFFTLYLNDFHSPFAHNADWIAGALARVGFGSQRLLGMLRMLSFGSTRRRLLTRQSGDWRSRGRGVGTLPSIYLGGYAESCARCCGAACASSNYYSGSEGCFGQDQIKTLRDSSLCSE
jgi:hypothetical protein